MGLQKSLNQTKDSEAKPFGIDTLCNRIRQGLGEEDWKTYDMSYRAIIRNHMLVLPYMQSMKIVVERHPSITEDHNALAMKVNAFLDERDGAQIPIVALLDQKSEGTIVGDSQDTDLPTLLSGDFLNGEEDDEDFQAVDSSWLSSDFRINSDDTHMTSICEDATDEACNRSDSSKPESSSVDVVILQAQRTSLSEYRHQSQLYKTERSMSDVEESYPHFQFPLDRSGRREMLQPGDDLGNLYYFEASSSTLFPITHSTGEDGPLDSPDDAKHLHNVQDASIQGLQCFGADVGSEVSRERFFCNDSTPHADDKTTALDVIRADDWEVSQVHIKEET